jgi:HEPN domain-containing protein
MPDSRDWQRWAQFAEDDFTFALEILERRPRHASFQLQQSAEKYLKAAAMARGDDPERTHDLSLLLVTLDASLTVEDRVVNAAQLLTLVGARSRYPDRFVETSLEEAQALLEAARVVRAFALMHLPS